MASTNLCFPLDLRHHLPLCGLGHGHGRDPSCVRGYPCACCSCLGALHFGFWTGRVAFPADDWCCVVSHCDVGVFGCGYGCHFDSCDCCGCGWRCGCDFQLSDDCRFFFGCRFSVCCRSRFACRSCLLHFGTDFSLLSRLCSCRHLPRQSLCLSFLQEPHPSFLSWQVWLEMESEKVRTTLPSRSLPSWGSASFLLRLKSHYLHCYCCCFRPSW
mmetsp:Transcript_15715/g.23923  ORF Transcript_15715/g.23923 Transcript_15715/m.23923 type:complete len:214 (+) Transcript_15715:310-951(+)